LKRELFSIGAFHLHSYGLMLCISFLLSVFIMYYWLKRHFIDAYAVFDMVVAALVGGILGARIFYILGNLDEFKGHWLDILKFWNVEGLVFYGGLLLGAALTIAVIRWKGLPLPVVADGAALCLALGLAVTRIGCFLNGCCFGKPSGMPWAVTFPLQTQLEMGMPPNPLHPTQLYESLLDLALFVLLLLLCRRLRYQGQLFLVFLAGYGLIRFSLEFLRYHSSPHAAPAFQAMSLLLVAAAGAAILFRARLLPEVRR
jgi:phosphatidylglycerol:prolipoprotein diacylglycerol transferase